MCAYNVSSQTPLWCSVDNEAGFGSITPNPANGSVFYVDTNNELVNLNATTGATISSYGDIEVSYGVGVAPQGSWGVYIYEQSSDYLNCYAGASGAQEWSVVLPGEITPTSFSAPLIHKHGYVVVMGNNPGGCGDTDQVGVYIYKVKHSSRGPVLREMKEKIC